MPVDDYQQYMRVIIEGLADDLGNRRTRLALAALGLLMPSDRVDEDGE